MLPAPPELAQPNCLDCIKKPKTKEPEEPPIRYDQKPINIIRAMITPNEVNTTDNTTLTTDSHPVDRLIASVLINNSNEDPKPKFDAIPEEPAEPKVYRTHVTLIMKQQNETEVCHCKMKNETKDATTNTDDKKEVKKKLPEKPNIKSHSCVDAPPVEPKKGSKVLKKGKAKEIGVQTEVDTVIKPPVTMHHHVCCDNLNCKETQTTTEVILDTRVDNKVQKEWTDNNRHVHVNTKNNNEEHRLIITENNNGHVVGKLFLLVF